MNKKKYRKLTSNFSDGWLIHQLLLIDNSGANNCGHQMLRQSHLERQTNRLFDGDVCSKTRNLPKIPSTSSAAFVFYELPFIHVSLLVFCMLFFGGVQVGLGRCA